MSSTARITDVAPRDGLQNESRPIATADKLRLVQALHATGVNEIEVSSFVSPKWIPQLADAAELFAALAPQKPAGLLYSALVPNQQGFDAALKINASAGWRVIDKVSVFTAASESFSRRNTNATIAETLKRFEPVIAGARQAGLITRAYVSCAVRCPFEGDIAPSAVAELCRQLAALDIDELDIADTIGAGTPETVVAVLDAILAALGDTWLGRITLHLHDTFGGAAACAVAAWRRGVTSFDSAAGGLGGCPYASTPQRRAPGNIATSALVSALRAAGADVQIDDAALAAADTLARQLVTDRA